MSTESISRILPHLKIKLGDITKEHTDAIVNAASPALLGGGGVDGAIHRAAGKELLEECRSIGGCLPGEARLTKGYRLPCRYVIHTPGPVYKDGKSGEKKILAASYANSLQLAANKGLKTIAFPAISAGIYGYPKAEACQVAVTSVIDFMLTIDKIFDITFVLFDEENYEIYSAYLSKLKHELQ